MKVVTPGADALATVPPSCIAKASRRRDPMHVALELMPMPVVLDGQGDLAVAPLKAQRDAAKRFSDRRI
jgi:hypothetical protein